MRDVGVVSRVEKQFLKPMKTKAGWTMLGVGGLLMASALVAATTASKPDNAPAQPPATELKESQEREAANKEHIRPARAFIVVETPPPPARKEEKPPQPSAGMKWVPGQWSPRDGKWEWKAGQWDFPATPISVWIEAKYDEKTKRWTAGYWQPDRPAPYEPEPSNDETPPPTPKFL